MVPFEVAFAILCGVLDGAYIKHGSMGGTLSGQWLWRSLLEVTHSDDDNHEGESIYHHTRTVYDQLGLSVDHPSLIESTGAWAAVIHDVGKIWTREWNGEKAKYTFYKHGSYSADVARLFLERMDRVPLSMAIIPDYGLVDMVAWHDKIISLQHDRKDDFTHMKKVYKAFENAAVRRVFLQLVRADCQPKAADKKQKWAEDFSNDFIGYQHHLEIEEKVATEKRYQEQLKFDASKATIEIIVREALGEEAVEIVTKAETPKDIGKLFSMLGKAEKTHIIKQVKALYEVN